MKKSSDPDVRLLQALAEPTRLEIVRRLSERDEICACDFVACCAVEQPTVSHHLKVLRDAGVVTGTRRGSWVYYRLEPPAVARIRALLASIGGEAAAPPTEDVHLTPSPS